MRKSFFIFIFLFVFPLLAQNESIPEYTLKDTIVVVAGRYTVPLKKLSETYQSIDSLTIQQISTHSVLETVDFLVPSAFVLDKKVMGYGVGVAGAGDISIRGLGGKPNNSVLVLVDGHPDFMGLFGHPLPDVYGNDEIQRVEILTGSSKSLFGSNALGGIINIMTSTSPGIVAQIEGGSFNTYSGYGNVSHSFGKNLISVSYRYRTSDGHADKTSFSSSQFSGRWEMQLNPRWKFSLQGKYVPYQFDDPSRPDSGNAIDTYAKIRRGYISADISGSYTNASHHVQIFYNGGHHEFYDGFVSDDYLIGISQYSQSRINNGLQIATGVDAYQYGGKANVNTSTYTIKTFGWYGMGIMEFPKGIRTKLGVRVSLQNVTTPIYSPFVGISYLFQNIHLFANYSQSFRLPTIQELYLFPISNPDLSPVLLKSGEFGFRFQWKNKLILRSAGYINHLTQNIQLVGNPTPPPPVRFTSSGKANQLGFEQYISYDITKNNSIRVAYSYLDPDNLTAFNPKHQVKMMIQGRHNNFLYIMVGKYIKDLFAQNNGQQKLKDEIVVDASITWMRKNYSFSLKLKNILNQKYEILPGYSLPGFYILGSIKYRIK